MLKGAAPIWVAQAVDLDVSQQIAAGVACIVGHNWSVWIGFKGGRGMSILLGVLLAVARLELLLVTIIALFGIAFWGSVPLFLGLSAALLPMWSWLLERGDAYILGLGLMALAIIVKRLLGNELPKRWSCAPRPLPAALRPGHLGPRGVGAPWPRVRPRRGRAARGGATAAAGAATAAAGAATAATIGATAATSTTAAATGPTSTVPAAAAGAATAAKAAGSAATAKAAVSGAVSAAGPSA